uniref:Uncharacterized protein n=1 Tax=Rhizophora mucronata TaxID=61149 RepID=A0A2P2Q2S1_RHIMU
MRIVAIFSNGASKYIFLDVIQVIIINYDLQVCLVNKDIVPPFNTNLS